VVGLVLLHFGELSLKTQQGFCWGLFSVCLGFYYPICISVRHDNGVTFRVVSYVIFWGFLSGPSELVGVQVCKCCGLISQIIMLSLW
jgi:hypothetical protein